MMQYVSYRTRRNFPATLRIVRDSSDTPGGRLRATREALGLTAAELGRKSGLGESTIRSYENGSRNLTVESAKQLGPWVKKSWEWLILGDAPSAALAREIKVRGEIDTPKSRAGGRSLTVSDHAIDIGGDAYVQIGVYDIRAAAGAGSINASDGVPEHFNLYRLDWLRRVTTAQPSQLAVIRVAGDSMWETLHDGDHVLVDRTVRLVKRDGIYIIRRLDELQVKRVAAHPVSGLLTVKSDNPAYTVWENIRPKDLPVEGRVIWLGRNIGG